MKEHSQANGPVDCQEISRISEKLSHNDLSETNPEEIFANLVTALQNNKAILTINPVRGARNRSSFFRTIALFALIFLPFVSIAQQLDFHSLGDEIPLPASETYNILQDSSGFIWFATEAGYCRYQRGKVEVFDEKKGLPEKSVYAAAVDEKGVLYVFTRDIRILYFDGKKFVESGFTEAYRKATALHWSYAFNIKFIGNKMYLYGQGNTVVIDRSTNQISLFVKVDNLVNCMVVKRDVFLFESDRSSTYPDNKIFFTLNGNQTSVPLEKQVSVYPPVCAVWNNKTVFADYKKIWVFENGRLAQSADLPDHVLSMKFDKIGNLLVGFLNEGLYRFAQGNVKSLPLISLSGLSVSGILVSGEGSIWCTTLEDGVHYCLNPILINYQNTPGLNKRLLLLNESGGSLFAASNEGAIYYIGNQQVKPFVKFRERQRFTSVLKDGNEYLLTSQSETQFLTAAGKFIPVKTSGVSSSIYKAFGSDRSYLLIYYFNIRGINRSTWPNTYWIQNFKTGRARGALQANDSLILIYGKNMLVVYNSEQLKEYASLYRELDYTDATVALDGNVYLTTKSDGVYRYSISDRRLDRVNFSSGDKLLLSIKQDNEGRFWLGTNTGVLLTDSEWKKTINLSNLLSLPHSEVRLLEHFHDSIYFGTNEGLFVIPENVHFPHIKVYPPKLEYFLNKGRKFSVANPEGWFGEVTVKLLIPCSGDVNEVFYTFSDGSASEPIQLEGDKITFSQLQPGTYNLSMYAVDKFGNKSRQLTCSFVIAAHYYQTWWFIGLAGIAFVALVLLAYVRTIRIIRKREARKTEINTQLAEFQMSALQAQMNPHFIFNAINTIQSYILTRNKEDAYRYLTKFSNLIRLVLHNSQEKFIPLVEELEVINTYLELEQARFSNFTYRVDIQPDIDVHETMVPAMLVQPYLENAVWHGLGHLTERPGQLTLTFRISEDCLQIEIRDNGIGRQAASKNKRSTHKSVGTSITQQRLETLAQLNEGGIATVEVIDLYENSIATGTLIVIKVSLPDNS